MNEVANRQPGFNAWDKSVELFVTVGRRRRCDRGFLYDMIRHVRDIRRFWFTIVQLNMISTCPIRKESWDSDQLSNTCQWRAPRLGVCETDYDFACHTERTGRDGLDLKKIKHWSSTLRGTGEKRGFWAINSIRRYHCDIASAEPTSWIDLRLIRSEFAIDGPGTS
jgi:hypothetical protein